MELETLTKEFETERYGSFGPGERAYRPHVKELPVGG